MSDENSVLSRWIEFKTLVEVLDLDVHKNASGNSAAGVRSRKGLRTLKAKAAELVKLTVSLDKDKKTVKL
jgi:Histone H1-like protein Hc1